MNFKLSALAAGPASAQAAATPSAQKAAFKPFSIAVLPFFPPDRTGSAALFDLDRALLHGCGDVARIEVVDDHLLRLFLQRRDLAHEGTLPARAFLPRGAHVGRLIGPRRRWGQLDRPYFCMQGFFHARSSALSHRTAG